MHSKHVARWERGYYAIVYWNRFYIGLNNVFKIVKNNYKQTKFNQHHMLASGDLIFLMNLLVHYNLKDLQTKSYIQILRGLGFLKSPFTTDQKLKIET